MDVDMDDDETDADSDMEEDEGEEWEATIEEGPCTGILDVVFTGVTEERHGDAWCHYMYYGRLREWDGLIVLVGVPVSLSSLPFTIVIHTFTDHQLHPPVFVHPTHSLHAQNDINERLWGKWIFRGYLHGGQNFTGRWRHYAYDLFSPAYEGAFTLSKRDDSE